MSTDQRNDPTAVQRVEWRIEHVMRRNGPPLWDDVLSLRDVVTQQAEEIARLRAERDALCSAINPDWQGWAVKDVVVLAEAHRSDSLIIDELEVDGNYGRELVSRVQAQAEEIAQLRSAAHSFAELWEEARQDREAAQLQVRALQAHLSEAQQRVETLRTALSCLIEDCVWTLGDGVTKETETSTLKEARIALELTWP